MHRNGLARYTFLSFKKERLASHQPRVEFRHWNPSAKESGPNGFELPCSALFQVDLECEFRSEGETEYGAAHAG
jgi:hypothetical protein